MTSLAQGQERRDLVSKAREVTRSISTNKQYLSREERRQVRRLLNRILRIVEGEPVPQPPPQPVPPRPNPRLGYTGHCELDDDKQFDPGQDVIGTVRGSTAIEVISACAEFAELRYGNSGSYKVTSIQIEGRISARLHQTVCHVDDDTLFDANQNVIPLAGNSVYGMIQECRSIGNFMFPVNTIKLIGTQLPADADRLPVTANCHVDDDRQFDANQDVFPMAAYSKLDIEQECSSVADLLYGSNNSWRVFY